MSPTGAELLNGRVLSLLSLMKMGHISPAPCYVSLKS